MNFLSQDDVTAFRKAGWHIREGVQFHWHNQSYQGFDDFLGALSSRKRKNIKKERASLAAHNISFMRLTGDEITPAHWDYFYEFYLATIEKKWGGAYLTRGFFDAIGQTMADRIVLVLAQKDRQIVAGALNLVNEDCLFGRNWGALVDIPNLHFETCYYQAIEHAIEQGLSRVRLARKACIRCNEAICLLSPIQHIILPMRDSRMRLHGSCHQNSARCALKLRRSCIIALIARTPKPVLAFSSCLIFWIAAGAFCLSPQGRHLSKTHEQRRHLLAHQIASSLQVAF